MLKHIHQSLRLGLFNQYINLPKPIYILFLVKMTNIMGSSFVIAFLPLFLNEKMGIPASEIGKYVVGMSSAFIFGSIIGGKMADRIGRKRTLLISYLCSAVAYLVSGFLSDNLLVIPLIFVGFLFCHTVTPAISAMSVDYTDQSNRQVSFSLIYQGANLGYTIGPLVAGFLFNKHLEWIFWGQTGIILCGVLLIALFIDDTVFVEDVDVISNNKSCFTKMDNVSFLQSLQSPLILGFIICVVLIYFAFSMTTFILPLQMKDVFGIDNGIIFYGISCSLNGIGIVVGTPVLIYLTKNYPPLRNLLIASILYFVAYGSYSIVKPLALFYILTLIWTSGEVLSNTNIEVFLSNHSGNLQRARFQSINGICMGIGRCTGPFFVSIFLINNTIQAAWILIAVVCLIAGIGFIILRRMEIMQEKQKKHESNGTLSYTEF
jgi:predicted MFS family arabinose efflux permease